MPDAKYISVYRPYLNLLRMMRVLKLLQKVPQFVVLCECIVNLISVSFAMTVLLLITALSFAIVGFQGFGGLLYPTNPLLKSSDYASNGYGVFNFNDMVEAFMTLFNMLICGYMPEYADAMGRVSSLYFTGTLYCGAFF